MKKMALIQILSSFSLFVIALLIPSSTLKLVLFITSYLLVGAEVIFHTLKGLGKSFLLDEHFLMALATIGAFLIGEYSEAVMVMILYQIGELFTDHAVERSEAEISKLMEIRPDYAHLLTNGKERKVSPEQVTVDDIILVKSGEKIPLDGIVLEGKSTVDTSSLTGEALPQVVCPGDSLISGCINLSGTLQVKVTKEFQDSTVHKILELVKNASHKKSSSEKFITKFSKYYTPIVVFLAFVIALFSPLLFSLEWRDSIERAFIFLVVSCPCALVISVPLGFFSGIGGASRRGILIKGSNYLEKLSHIDCFVFDKTGTLTKGVFEVTKVESYHITKGELVYYAACCEIHSSHPIAQSIKNYYGKNLPVEKVTQVEENSGLGASATVEQKRVLVGNLSFLIENGISIPKGINEKRTVYVALDGEYCGAIVMNDVVKPEAFSTIQELKKLGIKQCVMLTGDKEEIASSISEELGLDQYYAGLLPHDKVARLEMLLKDYQVAFVGDGINDAPVLSMSDIGISMGELGSDAAIEASDMVIMTDQLHKLTEAVKISRKTLRIVKENIVFAILIKIIILLLGVFGCASMWGAVLADVGVSILAIFNSIRAFQIS